MRIYYVMSAKRQGILLVTDEYLKAHEFAVAKSARNKSVEGKAFLKGRNIQTRFEVLTCDVAWDYMERLRKIMCSKTPTTLTKQFHQEVISDPKNITESTWVEEGNERRGIE